MTFTDLFVPRSVRFDVFVGTCYENKADTFERAMVAAQKAAKYRRQKARVVVTRPAPDGGFPVSPPVPGGTWGGRCGSTKWLDAPGIVIEQDVRVHDLVRRSQRWYRSSVEGWPNVSVNACDERIAPGFRVECEGANRHLGLCGLDPERWPLLSITWDPYTSIKYEPMTLRLVV